MTHYKSFDLYNPTDEHKMLRETIASFTQTEVEPQAHEYDRKENFNLVLFRKAAELGLMGITVPEEYGGLGLDFGYNAIVDEEQVHALQWS